MWIPQAQIVAIDGFGRNMDAELDTMLASSLLDARRRVQRLADALLGAAADAFLYRGMLFGEGMPGQHISGLLCYTGGCEAVLWLLERLEANETLEAVILDECGQEPDDERRPVLALLDKWLSYVWPDGQIERV